MVGLNDSRLGTGLYTPAEAARYVKAQPQAVARWLWGDLRGERVLSPELGDSKSRIVTFLDLIQALAIRNLRTRRETRRVSLPRIREVIQVAQQQYGLQYPFAKRHTLYLFDCRIYIYIGDELIGVTSGDRGQILANRIVEPFLEEIDFREDDDMADRWSPLSFNGFAVRLDPERRFGQPIIEPDGILVSALADAYEEEGTFAAAAESFEVKPDAVKLAVKYRDDYLTGITS